MVELRKEIRLVEHIIVDDVFCDICENSLIYEHEGITIKGDLLGYDPECEDNMYLPIQANICVSCFKTKVLPLFPKGVHQDLQDKDKHDIYIRTESSTKVDVPLYMEATEDV